jgi:hypothetical protein
MRNLDAARKALLRAEQSTGELDRTVWLAKAADHAISRQAVLVGGAAVNLHTGSYHPTDIDLCAYLDQRDRDALESLGFEHIQGDHFAYTFRDGERWPLEFPDSTVDGDVIFIELENDSVLTMISTESLVVDRIRQATDRTDVTFSEAARLCRSVLETANWDSIERQILAEDRRAPLLRLKEVYERVLASVR